MNRKQIGQLAEQASIHYLMKKGYHILCHSYRNRFGEIDIIAFDQEILVFVEVKLRQSQQYGTPEEAVHWKKRQKIRQVALSYQQDNNLLNTSMRFDVITVEKEQEIFFRINHICQAF